MTATLLAYALEAAWLALIGSAVRAGIQRHRKN